MSDQNKKEEARPEEQTSGTVDASGRLRDKNGHFLSNPKGTAKNQQKKPVRDDVDKNTVKIKIVKESEPLPPKNFEGRLEDVKERTAINFIRSVVVRKPKRINIDGNRYYSAETVAHLVSSWKKERSYTKEATEIILEANEVMQALIEKLGEVEKDHDRIAKSKSGWKSLAIGMICGIVLGVVVIGASELWKTKSNAEKAAPVQMESMTEEQGK